MPDLFDHYADIGALEKETQRVLELFGQVKTGIADLSKLGFQIDSSKALGETAKAYEKLKDLQDKLAATNKLLEDSQRRLADVQKASNSSIKDLSGNLSALLEQSAKNEIANKALLASKKALDDQYKAGTLNYDDYVKSLSDIKDKQTQLKVSNEDVNKQLNNYERSAQNATDSTNQLAAKLILLQTAYDKLTPGAKASPEGQAQLAEITKLNEAVSQGLEITGRFKLNVGNYQGSAKIIVEALQEVEAKLDELKQKQASFQNFSNRDPVGFKLSGQGDELTKTTAQIGFLTGQAEALHNVVDNPQFLNIAGKIGDVRAETRFFTNQLVELRERGLENTDTFEALDKRLAELARQSRETKEEVRALSSNSRGFDLFASSVGFATASFQALVGVEQLAAGKNEDVEKGIRKLIAVQSIANGVREIARQITEKGSAANKVYSIAINAVGVATDATATSAERLNAVIKLSVIGLAVTAIGFLVDALGIFNNKTDEAKDHVQEFENALGSIDNYVSIFNHAIDQTIGREKLLIAQRKQSSLEAVGDSASAADKRIAIEKAASDDLQKLDERDARNKKTALDKSIGDLGKEKDRQIKAAGENTGEVLKIIESFSGKFADLQKQKGDIDVELEANAIKRRTDLSTVEYTEKKKLKDKGIEDTKAAAKAESEALKSESEVRILQLQQEGALAKIIAASTTLSPEVRIAARKEQYKNEIKLQQEAAKAQLAIIDQTEREGLSKKDISINESGAIIRKAASERIKIEIDSSIKERDLVSALQVDIIKIRHDSHVQELAEGDKYIADEEKRIKDANEKLLADYSAQSDRIVANIQTRSNKEIEIENETLVNKLANTKLSANERQKLIEDNEIKIAGIQAAASQKELAQQIIFYRQMALVIEGYGGDATEIYNKIANAQSALQNAVADKIKTANKQLVANLQELKQKYIELGQTIIGSVQTVLDGFYDKQKNNIQGQIDLIDQQKQADEDRVNQGTDSAEKKAERVKIIDIQAQQSKQQLQEKQTEIDRRKAQFDKAAQAMSTTVGGIKDIARIKSAAAVVYAETLATIPPPAGLAIAAGLEASVLAQVPISIASTAASLLAILGTPIPKYAAGVKDSKAGYAIVGEAGRELGVDKQGKITLYNEPTLTELTAGTTIYPNQVTEAMIAGSKIRYTQTKTSDRANVTDWGEKSFNELKALNKKPVVHLIIQEGIEATPYYQQQMKR